MKAVFQSKNVTWVHYARKMLSDQKKKKKNSFYWFILNRPFIITHFIGNKWKKPKSNIVQ